MFFTTLRNFVARGSFVRRRGDLNRRYWQGCITEDRLAGPNQTLEFSLAKRLFAAPLAVVAVACAVVCSVVGGCRSNAYNDVYTQRMASEIRVLEDQLYDADYQNRVLQEKLERAAQRAEELEQAKADCRQPSKPERSPKPTLAPPVPKPLPSADEYSPSDFDLGDDVQSLDNFEAIAPGQSTPSDPFRDDAETAADALPQTRKPETPPSDAATPKVNKEPGLLPPPGLPQPPGKEDLELPEIDPGELVPPPSPDGALELPPGQIKVPDAVNTFSPDNAKPAVPTSLSIHPGLSAMHVFEDGSEGMYLVVNVLDEQNQPLDLDSFEIDAPLTVLALDPEKELEASKIGRWEFTSEQVAKLVRKDPVSGLAIPVRWQDKRPTGDSVTVHVRIKGDEEEMRCEGELRTKSVPEMAQWMPRSPSASGPAAKR